MNLYKITLINTEGDEINDFYAVGDSYASAVGALGEALESNEFHYFNFELIEEDVAVAS